MVNRSDEHISAALSAAQEPISDQARAEADTALRALCVPSGLLLFQCGHARFAADPRHGELDGLVGPGDPKAGGAYRVIGVDLLGHGRSASPAGGYGLRREG